MTETPNTPPSTPDSPAVPGKPGPDGTLVTTLNKRWVMKMGIFFLAMMVLGVWGALDAFWIYPKRGFEFAEYRQKEYLEAADKAGAIVTASVERPADALRAFESAPPNGDVEIAKRRWLEALKIVVNLEKLEDQIAAGQSPAYSTSMPEPRKRLEELAKKWQNRTQPNALSQFDIPVQYLFMIIGLGLAGYIVVFLLRCSTQKFVYRPAEHRLTLPNGRSFVPTDIDEIDRRLWHKFYVHLKLTDASPEIKLDLLRFWPLEDWFLDMERHWPKYVPPEQEPAEEAAPSPQEAAPGS